jgi:hypothetical protein
MGWPRDSTPIVGISVTQQLDLGPHHSRNDLRHCYTTMVWDNVSEKMAVDATMTRVNSVIMA